MIIFLLIYTHIAAIVLGVVFLEWWATRSRFWVDVWALAFIIMLWPLVVWFTLKKWRAGK